MAGVRTLIVFTKDQHYQIETVARRLTLTKQQFIRQAIEEKLQQYDLFKMAGGVYPDAPLQGEVSD